ncbi:MAG: RpiB/LacA/LacB family sugar-phosphate isomerase [Planctomycetota bacterium]
MKIAIGADHRGNDAAREVMEHLLAQGHDVDVNAVCDIDSCDYPDKAFVVASLVANGDADLGVLICGSGIGMCIAANKVPGVRAALAWDGVTAELSRRHNNANVLCLSGDLNSSIEIFGMVNAWLSAEFEAGRHERRVRKITAIEEGKDPSTVVDAAVSG